MSSPVEESQHKGVADNAASAAYPTGNAVTERETAEWQFPVYVGHRRRLAPDNTLLDTGNEEREEACKQSAVCMARDAAGHREREAVLGGRELASYLSHKFECSTCHAALPTAHLLSCHISEMHDSYFAAQAARRMRVYCCLVEGCGRTFCTIEERKQHLVDHHRFPRNYNFDRIHLRRKKAQIRPLPGYRKAAPPADAFEGLVGRLGAVTEEESAAEVVSSVSAVAGTTRGAGGGRPDASRAAGHEEVLHRLGSLSMAAAQAAVPEHVSFGRRMGGRGVPGAGKGGRGAAEFGGALGGGVDGAM